LLRGKGNSNAAVHHRRGKTLGNLSFALGHLDAKEDMQPVIDPHSHSRLWEKEETKGTAMFMH
jgi:hypothetical protein